MPRKRKTIELPEIKTETKKVFTEEEIEAGLEIVHSEYFMHVLGLVSHNPTLKELTFVRVPIQTPEGGLYLVSILHVDGPKIDLQKLAEKADAIVAEEKKNVL